MKFELSVHAAQGRIPECRTVRWDQAARGRARIFPGGTGGGRSPPPFCQSRTPRAGVPAREPRAGARVEGTARGGDYSITLRDAHH